MKSAESRFEDVQNKKSTASNQQTQIVKAKSKEQF